MGVPFPSVEFFRALQKGLAENPSSTEGVEPSEAYCGFSIDDQLYVFEFDGHSCAAVLAGGNPLDLDFVLSGSRDGWYDAVSPDAPRSVAELIRAKAIEIETEADDGRELATAALPMLQVFLNQARALEIERS